MNPTTYQIIFERLQAINDMLSKSLDIGMEDHAPQCDSCKNNIPCPVLRPKADLVDAFASASTKIGHMV